ncbi:hypothetical protein PIB30_111060, partial [Stylosanthes scabra]|nr:hypothetical protein [Stylosanthes scabra]
NIIHKERHDYEEKLRPKTTKNAYASVSADMEIIVIPILCPPFLPLPSLAATDPSSSSVLHITLRAVRSCHGLPSSRPPRSSQPLTVPSDAVFSQTLDLGKYTESYQVIYHYEVEYRSHED